MKRFFTILCAALMSVSMSYATVVTFYLGDSYSNSYDVELMHLFQSNLIDDIGGELDDMVHDYKGFNWFMGTENFSVTGGDGKVLAGYDRSDGYTFIAVLAPFNGVAQVAMHYDRPYGYNAFDVTFLITAVGDPVQNLFEGAGTEQNPYLISTLRDWYMLCAQVNGGYSYAGQYFRLANNLTVKGAMVGTDANHAFSGTFDGNGHTLTVRYDRLYTDGVAPFHYVDGATFKNLVVNGSIEGGRHSAGLVALVKGGSTCTIENCRVSANVAVNNGSIYGGGVVGHATAATVRFVGCVYNGTIRSQESSTNIDYATGGFVGWCDSGAQITLKDCLYKGNIVCPYSTNHFNPLVSRYYGATVTVTLNNTYSRYDFTPDGDGHNNDGTTDCRRANPIIPTEGITVAMATSPRTVYSVSGITAYAPGIQFDGVLYGTNQDQISLNLGGSDSGYATSTGTLTGEQNPYTLTLADADCEIFAMTSNNWEENNQGTEQDPYLIADGHGWSILVNRVNEGNNYQGKYFRLTGDIAVNELTVVGPDAAHAFAGTLDGNGHTITASINGKSAPFPYVDGATFKNLVVTGLVSYGQNHTSGLVGFVKSGSTCTIQNCHISTYVNCGSIGAGLVGHAKDATVNISGCVFDGTVRCVSGAIYLLDSSTWTQRGLAGFVGWCETGAHITLTDCLFKGSCAWADLEGHFNPLVVRYHEATNVSVTVNNTYCCYDFTPDTDDYNNDGTTDCRRARAVTSGDWTTIAMATGQTAAYAVSGITAYSTGFLYNGAFYAMANEAFSLNLSGSEIGYMATTGTLSGEANPYTLTLEDADCVILALNEWHKSGDGTQQNPYLIESAADWNALSGHVSIGKSYSGKYFLLTDDIAIQEMVGADVDNAFSGTFDGDGHTITVSISGTGQGTAPFCYTDSATIKNLVVTGSVTGSGHHSSGLVGFVKGGSTCTIENCRISTNVNAGILGAGVVGHARTATVHISGCVYDGTITSSTNSANTERALGGFVGWTDSRAHITLTDCIFNGNMVYKDKQNHFNPLVSRSNNATNVVVTVNNSYCFCAFTPDDDGKSNDGTTDCRRARAIIPGYGVSVSFAAEPTASYSINNITGYGKGILYGGVLYAADQENLRLNFSGSNTGYTASTGTLGSDADPYTLTMEDADCRIRAITVPDEWDETTKTLTVNNNLAKRAYEGHTEIEHVIVSDTVTVIGDYAFAGCTNLQTVTCSRVTPPALRSNVFQGDDKLDHIYVSELPSTAYKAATNWADYASIIHSLYKGAVYIDNLQAGDILMNGAGFKDIAYKSVQMYSGRYMVNGEIGENDYVFPVGALESRNIGVQGVGSLEVLTYGLFLTTTFFPVNEDGELTDSWIVIEDAGQNGSGTITIAGYGKKYPEGKDFEGEGSEQSPYLIADLRDWYVLTEHVSADNSYQGKYFRLTKNITVTGAMIGADADHAFSGTFDGAGHTITTIINGGTNAWALFRYIDGATIKNLVVSGTINNENNYTSGLVGFVKGGSTCTIENCRISTNVNAGILGAGVVGHAMDATVRISGCVFDGTINSTAGSVNTECALGGFVGWCDRWAKITLTDCLFKGSYTWKADYKNHFNPLVARNHEATNVEVTVNNTYCRYDFTPDEDGQSNDGTTDCRYAYTVTPDDWTKITITIAGEKTKYDVAGITSYGTGVMFGGVIYATDKEVLSLNLSGSNRGYVASTGTLSGEANPYTLTMENADCQILPTAASDAWGGMEGTEQDPYLIENTRDWYVLTERVSAGNNYQGKYFLLTSDLEVQEKMIGDDEDHAFSGTIDGAGHTITVTINSTTQGTAPFRYIDGATIKNLAVTGMVNGGVGYHASGLVGFAKNGSTSTIKNCRISTNVKTIFGAGVVGHAQSATVRITGCVFDGTVNSITNEVETNRAFGGFVGWCDNGAKITLTDCLFKGSYTWKADYKNHFNPLVARYYEANVEVTVNNTYCFYDFTPDTDEHNNDATTDCRYPRAIYAGTGVTITSATEPTAVYDVSGITAYATGLMRQGVLYAADKDVLSLNLSGSYGYTASTGTLSGNANPYTLTMADADCEIHAVAGTNEWDENTKTLKVNSSPADNAYAGNAEIEHVVLGDEVTTIGKHAFANCPLLTTITIPESVNRIGEGAFDNCALLTDIYCYPDPANLTWEPDADSNDPSVGRRMKKEVTKCHVKRAFLSTYQEKFADIDVTFVGDLDGEPDTPTEAEAVESQKSKVESKKIIRDGLLFIERDGKMYNALGAEVR